MLPLLPILVCVCQPGPASAEFNLEYVRPAGDKFVLESAVTLRKTAEGFLYESVTHRPNVKMTLKLRFNAKQVLQTAELEQETDGGKLPAKVTFDKKTAMVTRPGQKGLQLNLAAEAVLATTAPDWSDIFLVLRRYDQKLGGKQEFVGVWFHPINPPGGRAFVVEELGKDAIAAGDKKLTLGRYRVQLRSGAYLVWADAEGKVYKLMPPGQPQSAVILKGQEKATAGLSDR